MGNRKLQKLCFLTLLIGTLHSSHGDKTPDIEPQQANGLESFYDFGHIKEEELETTKVSCGTTMQLYKGNYQIQTQGISPCYVTFLVAIGTELRGSCRLNTACDKKQALSKIVADHSVKAESIRVCNFGEDAEQGFRVDHEQNFQPYQFSIIYNDTEKNPKKLSSKGFKCSLSVTVGPKRDQTEEESDVCRHLAQVISVEHEEDDAPNGSVPDNDDMGPDSDDGPDGLKRNIGIAPPPSPSAALNPTVTSAKTESRIIGGEGVTTMNYPWQVQLIKDDHLYCGGTIISRRFVLTAAHCTSYLPIKDLVIGLGCTAVGDCAEEFKVRQNIIHPHYDPKTLSNDLALLELVEDVPDDYPPACLPKPCDTIDESNTQLLELGWGRVNEEMETSDTLKGTIVSTICNEICEMRYQRYFQNTLCIQSFNGIHCQGDGGGFVGRPREEFQDRGYTIDGVISFGEKNGKCDGSGIKGVAEVAPHYFWIKKMAGMEYFTEKNPIEEEQQGMVPGSGMKY